MNLKKTVSDKYAAVASIVEKDFSKDETIEISQLNASATVVTQDMIGEPEQQYLTTTRQREEIVGEAEQQQDTTTTTAHREEMIEKKEKELLAIIEKRKNFNRMTKIQV